MFGRRRELEQEIDELRRRLDHMEMRPALYQAGQPIRLAKTVVDPESEAYPTGRANTLWCEFVDGSFTATAGRQTATLTARGVVVLAHSLVGYVPKSSPVFLVGINTQWWIITWFRPVAIQLAEDHPGRGETFKVWLGAENDSTNGWTYDTNTEHDCIDWRCCESCGLPYPDKCATGFAFWRGDGVLEIFDLDCCAPDDDYYCSGGGSGS